MEEMLINQGSIAYFSNSLVTIYLEFSISAEVSHTKHLERDFMGFSPRDLLLFLQEYPPFLMSGRRNLGCETGVPACQGSCQR